MTRGVTIRLNRNQNYLIVWQGKVLATLDDEINAEILNKLKEN